MFAAGSRAEVTAPFKHANLPRFYLLSCFLVSGLLKMRGSLMLCLGRKRINAAMGCMTNLRVSWGEAKRREQLQLQVPPCPWPRQLWNCCSARVHDLCPRATLDVRGEVQTQSFSRLVCVTGEDAVCAMKGSGGTRTVTKVNSSKPAPPWSVLVVHMFPCFQWLMDVILHSENTDWDTAVHRVTDRW